MADRAVRQSGRGRCRRAGQGAGRAENAIKHASALDVAVAISAWTTPAGDCRVSLRLVDHGPGVPEADLSTIFHPFQRLGDVPAGDGVGLGLAVARGLAEAMNAHRRADPGGGLTIVLDMPAAAPTSHELIETEGTP
ncbi:MAG TPA: ATP-binding protein [Microlunatus sp.]|nr:ATP-binding protein [Microlunatus sp.]